MPAFRGINLRSGDIAEQLGILLLQSVALVAPVPRTEDVGIDAVVTLIKNYDSRRYIAEDSFMVQIKSASVDQVSFQDQAVSWLANLQLPFFIASVDRKTSNIKLYTTHNLSHALVQNSERKVINLKLLENHIGDTSVDYTSADIPIGPPVIEWSLDTIESDPDFIQKFHTLMKAHVQLSQKAIETRRISHAESIVWKTGELPKVNHREFKVVKNEAIDEITAPYVNNALFNMTLGDDLMEARSLYQLLEKTLDRKDQFEVIDGKKQLKKWTGPITVYKKNAETSKDS